MPNAAELPSLTAGFAPASREAWLDLVNKALKGGDYNRRLVAKLGDGVVIEPIYQRRADAVVTARGSAGAPWQIVVRVDHPEPGSAAALALADLEGGADGLSLVFADAAAARGYGLTARTVADLDTALAGMMLDLVAVRIEPGAAGRANAALLAALVARRGYKPEALKINFGLDPIGVLATRGLLPVSWAQMGNRLGEAITCLKGRGFAGPFITVDLRPFNEAGSSEAQELGIALAAGVAYGRALEAAGLAVADAFGTLSWTIAVDADQLMGLAKIRALRRLWARVCAASGTPLQPMQIHAETAWRMLTRQDAAVNMLRATTAAFAAGTGGADSVAVLPHSSALGLPDALSRRIARNTQLVLIEESSLWRVADPAAGSGAIEGLTDELVAAGWKQFQDIERDGGLIASLTGGQLQARIAATAAARNRDIGSRKAPITGTSEFPNLGDVASGVLDVRPLAPAATSTAGGDAPVPAFDALIAAFANGAARDDLAAPSTGTLTAPALPSARLAAPFEALREAADVAARGGRRPSVFLANLGPLADHGGRATWITNLLAAGGVAVVTNGGFTASGEAAAAFAASGAAAACLCGIDPTYELLAESTASALKAAGARHVMLAGKPGGNEAALEAAGIDQFLFAGQDVLAGLAELHRALGIAAL